MRRTACRFRRGWSTPAPAGRAGTAARTSLALELLIEFRHAGRTPCCFLGDRYEIFAAAQAAALLDVPVAHIGGGDVTRGADDEWFRLRDQDGETALPVLRGALRRVVQMGEVPARVFNVGGLGDETSARRIFCPRECWPNCSLCPNWQSGRCAGDIHETATGGDVAAQAAALLDAVGQHGGLYYIFTGANADAGGEEQLNEILRNIAKHMKTRRFSCPLAQSDT